MPKRRNSSVPFINLTKSGKIKRIKRSQESIGLVENENGNEGYDENVLGMVDLVSDGDEEFELNIAQITNDGSTGSSIAFESQDSADDNDDSINTNRPTSNDEGSVYELETPDASENEDSSDNFDISEDENVTGSPNQVKEFLRNWALDEGIKLSALTSLSTGLRQIHPSCFSKLPKDGRTILKTPTNLLVEVVPPGEYLHIGLKKQLQSIVQYYECQSLPLPNSFDILINIDGVKLYDSTASEMYPILFSLPALKLLENIVFPIGLYYGPKKPSEPSLRPFLQKTIDELNDCLNNGILVNNNMIEVNLIGFCCDAPAKSFIMGVVAHNGFYSCTRCKIKGQSTGPKGKKKRVFLSNECEPRTNEEFIANTYPNFTRRATPLVDIEGLNFVTDFVLDYMHLVCLGVMRKMLFTWVGCPGYPLSLRISRAQQDLVSEMLLSLRWAIPKEFARRPRVLADLKYWKATEFRLFLLYLGPIILKDVLNADKYNHFLALHIAMSILMNKDKCQKSDDLRYAESLLEHFVIDVIYLYDKGLLTHNFHGLLHIVDDIRHFSHVIPNITLHKLSAFSFENYMQKIKRMVRSKSKPLQQVGKRLGEFFFRPIKVKNSLSQPLLQRHHSNGPLLVLCTNPQYKEILFENFMLSTTPPNNCCGLRNGSIVMIENFAYSLELDVEVVIGRSYLHKSNFYPDPFIKSEFLGIHKVDKLSSRKYWPCSDIVHKYVCLPKNNYCVVFPLLHGEV